MTTNNFKNKAKPKQHTQNEKYELYRRWGDDDNDPVTFELFVNTSTWDAENKWAGWNRSWVNVTITKKQMFDDVIEAQWPSNAVYSQLGAEYMGNTTALSEMGKAPFECTMESNANAISHILARHV